jgi:hypothetical protein
MAQQDSTQIPKTGKFFYRDRAVGEYALYLDGEPVGWAATADEAEAKLDRLAYDQLHHSTGWATTPPPAQPLPSAEVVAEALDELAALPSDTAQLFFHARARLRAGVRVVPDLAIFWIDGHAVRHDPANTGWPWACACARERCWHGALAEALTLAAEHPRVLDLAA